MKKSLILFSSLLLGLFAVNYIKAASGDLGTIGYDSANNRDVWRVNSSGDLVPGADNTYSIGTTALSVSDLVLDDDLTVGDDLTVTDDLAVSGDLNVTLTGDISGQVTLGAAGTKSTHTSTGNLDIGGALDVTGATILDSSLSVNSTLTMQGGAMRPYQRTAAQICALTPAQAGEVYSCSNCTNTYTLCVSTGTGACQFRQVGQATGCN